MKSDVTGNIIQGVRELVTGERGSESSNFRRRHLCMTLNSHEHVSLFTNFWLITELYTVAHIINFPKKLEYSTSLGTKCCYEKETTFLFSE